MFDLRAASKEIRAIAREYGIRTGSWEPVNAGVPVRDLPPDAAVARVYGTDGTEIIIRAGELQ